MGNKKEWAIEFHGIRNCNDTLLTVIHICNLYAMGCFKLSIEMIEDMYRHDIGDTVVLFGFSKSQAERIAKAVKDFYDCYPICKVTAIPYPSDCNY